MLPPSEADSAPSLVPTLTPPPPWIVIETQSTHNSSPTPIPTPPPPWLVTVPDYDSEPSSNPTPTPPKYKHQQK